MSHTQKLPNSIERSYFMRRMRILSRKLVDGVYLGIKYDSSSLSLHVFSICHSKYSLRKDKLKLEDNETMFVNLQAAPSFSHGVVSSHGSLGLGAHSSGGSVSLGSSYSVAPSASLGSSYSVAPSTSFSSFNSGPSVASFAGNLAFAIPRNCDFYLG